MSIDVSKLTPRGLLKLLVNGSILPETKTKGTFESLMVLWDNRTQRFKRVQRGWFTFQVTIPSKCLFDLFDAMPKKRVDGTPVRSLFQIVSVNLDGYYSPSTLKRFFGGEDLEPITRFNPRSGEERTVGYRYHGERVAVGKDGQFELTLIGVNSNVRAKLAAEALATAEKKLGVKYYVFPAHSNWITRRSSSSFNVLVTKNIDVWRKLVTELDGETPSEERLGQLAIRAGKDAWPAFVSTLETKVIRVFREELSKCGTDDCLSDDGIVYVRESSIVNHGAVALVKGLTRGLKRNSVLKGRILNSSDQATVGPNGRTIPDHVAGWCYASGLKWNNISIPAGQDYTDVTIVYGITKREEFDRKDSYRLNTYWSILGDFPDHVTSYIHQVLRRGAERKADQCNNLDEWLTKSIIRGMHGNSEFMLTDGDIGKWLLGFYSCERVSGSRNRIAKSFMSERVGNSMYPAVIYTTHVMTDDGVYELDPDEYVPSTLVRDGVLEGRQAVADKTGKYPVRDTTVRYPLITEGSFLSLSMSKYTADVSGYVIFCHPLAGVAQQGDCDDFVMLVAGLESNVKPSGFTASIEKHVKKADGELTRMSAYFHGRRSQELTGIFVAAYVACVADIKAFGGEKGGTYLRMLAPLAQSIQDSVQGIKKYNDTRVGITEAYELVSSIRLAMGVDPTMRSMDAIMVSPKVEDLDVVGTYYQVDISTSSLTGNHKLRDYNLELTDAEKALMNKAWKLGYMAFDYEFVSLLMEEVVGVTRQQVYDDPSIIDGLDSSRLVRAIKLYTCMAYTLANRQPKYAKAKFIQMSGLTLWIGSELEV